MSAEHSKHCICLECTSKEASENASEKAHSLYRSGSVSVSRVIKTDRIMWKLINGIRDARITRNASRIKHLEARYERFERNGWAALQ